MIDSDLVNQLKDRLSFSALLDIYPSIFDKAEVAKLILDPKMGYIILEGICPNCNMITKLKMINQSGAVMINSECCDAILGISHPFIVQKLDTSVLGAVKCLV